MPKPPGGKTYIKQYAEHDLLAAVAAIKDGMAKREAARRFNIPRATLQFRLSGNLIKTRPGPSTVLSETEEKKLAEWIITSSKKGFPRRKEDVLHSVEQFMLSTPRPSKFKDNKPGEGWYKLYLKRHPEIAQRTAEAVTSASANVSEDNIRNWFKQIENTLTDEELKIVKDPNRIFNGDETGFQLCPKQGKVLAEKGSRDVYEIDMAAAKSSITVMFTFSASGLITPPLVIYPLKRMRADIRESVPPHWGISLSDNGWMTKEIFSQYVTNILHPHLVSKNVEFPVILFLDGHKSHINYDLSQKCKELGIVLVALYPNATRILQPADVSAFKPLKNEWRKALLEWRRNNLSKQLTKVDFGRILTTVVEKYIKKEVIINGFRACGLYPWNPDAINYAKCLGKQTQAEPVPKHYKKLTMSDFQKLVDSDIISKLQSEVSIQNNRFYKSLENIYKFLKDEKISDDVSNDQGQLCIGDEWVPIDDIPMVIVPNATDPVEEFRSVTSEANCNLLDYQGPYTEVTERGQIVTSMKKINIERKNNDFEIKSTETKETENMELETKQIEEIILAANLVDIKETENSKDIEKETPEKRCSIKTLATELSKGDDNKYTEQQETNSDLLKGNEDGQAKDKNINNAYMGVIETEKSIDIQINRTLHENIDEININKMNEVDIYNICFETKEIENTEEIQKNMDKLEQIFEKLDNTDSINEISTPKKIDDFLYKAPTPKRKGKIMSKNTGVYVLTSEKWLESEKKKQNEKEKLTADKEERKKARQLAKEAKEIKNKENKKINKRKCTDGKKIQPNDCKKRKANKNKNKEVENITNENEKILSSKATTNKKINKIYKNIKEQCKHKYDHEITLISEITGDTQISKNETETILICEEIDKTQSHQKDINRTLLTIETDNKETDQKETDKIGTDDIGIYYNKTDNKKEKEIKKKGLTKPLVSPIPADKKGKINIISNIPISDHDVRRILFAKDYDIKPDLVSHKIPNRRTTFRNEQELEDYLNNCSP